MYHTEPHGTGQLVAIGQDWFLVTARGFVYRQNEMAWQNVSTYVEQGIFQRVTGPFGHQDLYFIGR